MASSRIVLIVACVLVLGLYESSAARQRECPSVCTQQYDPVCGRRANGSTREFGNGCFLGIHNCQNPGDIVSSRRGRC